MKRWSNKEIELKDTWLKIQSYHRWCMYSSSCNSFSQNLIIGIKYKTIKRRKYSINSMRKSLFKLLLKVNRISKPKILEPTTSPKLHILFSETEIRICFNQYYCFWTSTNDTVAPSNLITSKSPSLISDPIYGSRLHFYLIKLIIRISKFTLLQFKNKINMGCPNGKCKFN